MSKLLNAREVAERLGMSKTHVLRMLDNNQITHVRIPGRSVNSFSRRVDSDDLEKWIAEHKTTVAA